MTAKFSIYGIVVFSLALLSTSCIEEVSENRLIAEGRYFRTLKPVPNEYIVLFKNDSLSESEAKSIAKKLADEYGGSVNKIYNSALAGFAISIQRENALLLASDERVRLIEENGIQTLDITPSNISSEEATTALSWGLDRIDQQKLPLDHLFTRGYKGSGVTAYIVDTGIRLSHEEFGGRATFGVNFTKGVDDDCSGHGTHVAGTVGGKTYGVANNVNLVSVKILDCKNKSTTKELLSGINWVTKNARHPAVANLSVGSSSPSVVAEIALRNSRKSGVLWAVAAGNDKKDACDQSPARVREILTVGATSSSDERSSFSNYGSCIDIFAPGSYIRSAWIRSDSDALYMNGTSMATPHVTGSLALVMEMNPNMHFDEVENYLLNEASINLIKNAGGNSPNRLLYIGNMLSSNNPTPNSASDISVGSSHSCYIDANQNIKCVGQNSGGQLSAPSGKFIHIAAGSHHNCAINTNNQTVCWGNNYNGQSNVPSGAYFQQLDLGGTHSCGIKQDATIMCWGSSYTAGTPPSGYFQKIATNHAHGCGIRTNGSLACWGRNSYGQSTPPSGTFTNIAVGYEHTCAVRSDHRILCWGRNYVGQANSPTGLFDRVAIGEVHSCGIKVDGTITCWGHNYDHQLEAPTGTFVKLSAYRDHSCGLRTDGSLVCWGDNTYGQCNL